MITNRIRELGMGAALVVALAGCSTTPTDPVITDATRMRLSRALEAQGDYASAASILRDPSAQPAPRAEPSPDLNRVMSLIQLGEIDEAMSVMRMELAARSDDTAFALGAARVAAGAGRPAIAGEIYRGVLAKHPSDVDAMVGDGVIRAQSGDMPGAIADFRQALARRPSDVAAKNNLDLALSMSGKAPAPMAAVAAAPDAAATVAVRSEPVSVPVAVVTPASSGTVVTSASLAPTPLVVMETAPPVVSGTPPSVAAALTKLQASSSAAPDQPGKLGWTGQPVAGAQPFDEEVKASRKSRAPKRDEATVVDVAAEPIAPVAPVQTAALASTPGAKLGWIGATQLPATQEPVAISPAQAVSPGPGKLGWTGVSPTAASADMRVAALEKPPGAPVALRSDAPVSASAEKLSAPGRQVAVQLGAFPTERDATTYWDKLRSAHSELLNGVEPQFTQALVHGQTYWRLRVGAFSGGPEARLFCEPLRAVGSACIEAF